MKKFVFLVILVSHSLAVAGSHWNEEQVVDYVHNSDYQRRLSWHQLSKVRFQGDEKILDVGCGDGRNTALLACLANRGHTVGIDPSTAMIDWAKKQYHESEFPHLTFHEGDANRLPDDTFDLITALFCLHIVKDKQSAILGLYEHLVPQGKVIAVIPPPPKCNPAFLEALGETMLSSSWLDYFQYFQSTFCFEELEDYIRYFRNAGFTLIQAEYLQSVDPFVNRGEFINWFMGTWPHIHCVPKHLRRSFVSEMVDRYLQKRPDGQSNDGVLYFHHGCYAIIAQRDFARS